MQVEHDLIFFVFIDSKNSGEVLHILFAILEHAVMVAFHAESQAKIDLIQIQPLLVVEIVFLVEGDHDWVMLVEKMDDLDRSVDEHEYHDEEGHYAARDRVNHVLTLEVESWQWRTKNVDPLQKALQVEVPQVPSLDFTLIWIINHLIKIN